jgi:threonine aldolase
MKSKKIGLRWFASDNHASVHPNVVSGVLKANKGHAFAYGDDPTTKLALAKFKKIFGPKSESFFVFNGTAANVLSLNALLKTHEAVLCAEGAHVTSDECGAFEAFTGSKLLIAPSADAKLNVEKLIPFIQRKGDQHHVQARVITITQSTEWGTVYSQEELKEIRSFKKKHGLFLHMDGARFANACVALKIEPRKMLELAGVDVLSFGGTKNGCFMAEAVVIMDSKKSHSFKYVRKQGMQLASKMRYISAQFNEYLRNDLWLHNAAHANSMAQYLAEQLTFIPGLEFVQKPQANALFVKIPASWNKKLLKTTYFYVWDSSQNILRIMTSWDTRKQEIDSLVTAFNGCSQ